MNNSVQQLRELLRLAAALRSFAAEAASTDYAQKLLKAAIELELRADFLAGHRADEPASDLEQEAARHAPVDVRI